MDFSSAAKDYARHRAGFPASFFARVPLAGRILDFGSGTGTLARGFRARGASVVALDRSQTMLNEASDLPMRVVARAERCPFVDSSFDAIVAGQCWHWFDGEAAAREAGRLLKPGGRLVIAHFNHLVTESRAAAVTEELILAHHPTWEMAGGDGLLECWRPYFAIGGMGDVQSFSYDEPVVYSHEDWRGRIRACNGVLALRDSARIAAFDEALRQRLAAEFPDPLTIPHRIFVISGTKPSA